MSATPPPTSPRWTSWVAAAAGLTASALLVRASAWRTVLEDERAFFFGADAYYHARRVLYTAARFPETLRLDPYVSFPQGGEPIWSPLFDAACAALVVLAVGAQDVASAERLLVWVAPVFGAATVLAVLLLGRRMVGSREALLAAGLLAILPAHFAYTRLGYLDHHAPVSLAAVVLVAVAVAFARVATRGGRRSVAAALGLGLALGLSLLLWPGMLLHVGAAELPLLVFALAQGRASRVRVASLLAGAHAVALALVAPFSLGQEWVVWGSFSPLVLSDFQPWLLATAAMAYLALAMLSARPRARDTWPSALSRAALAGVLALAPGLFLLGDMREGAQDAWDWFARQEAFQVQVMESQPLFMRQGRLDLGKPVVYLTPLLFLAPWWLASLGREAWRSKDAGCAVLAAYATVLLVATLFQFRFIDAFSPIMALCVGAWLPRAALRIRDLLRRAPVLARAAPPLLLLLALQPALAFHAPQVRENLRALQGEPPVLPVREARLRLLVQVGAWLREHTPPTAGYDDASGTPEYGVLSHWSDGHLLRYFSRRPMVVDNFGDDVGAENFRLAHEYYLSGEVRASQILDRLRVRYVVFEYRPIEARVHVEPHMVFTRLYLQDGSASDEALALRGPQVMRQEREMPALSRYRLVYETEPKPQSPPPGRPAFKVFEHVAGARLVGRGEPGAALEARVSVETPQGRRFAWRATGEVGEDGAFALRIPYATEGAPPSVIPAPRLALRVGERRVQVAVPEEAVLRGWDVPVPDAPAPLRERP